jgi:DNA-binding transcriptional LysR family regulator
MGAHSDMVLFAAVVEEGSFTRAAQRLGVTKQTASERVAALEERLGVRLLERTTRRLRVTQAGGRYAERCTAIALQIEEAEREVQQQQAEPVGLLRVSAPVLYGRRYLAPVVADYLARYPRASVEVLLAERRVRLVEEGFDLAIRIGKLEDSSLAARKLGEGHVYYVASPGYLLRHGRPSSATLPDARCIATRMQERWRFDGVEVKLDPVLLVNDLEVACEAAIAGVGIARLPSLVCAKPVTERRLVVLGGTEPAERPSVYALFPQHRHPSAKLQVFLESLTKLVAPMAPIEELTKPVRPRRG